MDVGFRLVDHFFLKLSGADISKKINFFRFRQRESVHAPAVDVCGVTLGLTLRKRSRVGSRRYSSGERRSDFLFRFDSRTLRVNFVE